MFVADQEVHNSVYVTRYGEGHPCEFAAMFDLW
jgi:hypothetical protein